MPPSPSDALASLSTSLLDHDYRWRLANARHLPRSWTRTAVGAEAWLGRSGFLSTTNYNTYIRTTLSIRSPGISLAHLEYGMSRALVHLRFYRPEIACVSRTFQNDDYPGCPPEITYTVAKDAADVAAWASRTIHMARRPRHTFQHLSTFKVSDADVQPLSSFKIFFVLGTEQDETAEINVGSRVDLVFVFHPILWDAISSRTFVGDLLRYTVSLWSASTPQLETLRQYNWGTETDNLASSLLEASALGVYATSCDYVKTRDEHMRKLQQGAAGWGLPRSRARGRPRTIRRNLCMDECRPLRLAAKHFFGPDCTLTHLGHAAMLLALLHVSPMPPRFPSSTPVVSPTLLNGRRYLKGIDAPHRYGSCLATAFVDFAPLDQ
ncbi:hypothetical protein LY78DRAFT_707876 [Colletotrichum sublineola]|nr:hypothetical protein LY78DRAFT_707876 [Colletotrichum sublineola]